MSSSASTGTQSPPAHDDAALTIAPAGEDRSRWDRPCETLRRKWGTVPAGGGTRQRTQDMLALDDRELIATWEAIRAHDTTGPLYSHRGWYHDLYRDVLRGKRVADIGSGMGLDGVTFAQAGARMTFVDLVPHNLKLIERLCGLLGVGSAEFHLLDDLGSLKHLRGPLDVIWAQGSLHHAPRHIIRDEAQMLLERLPVGGRWIQLAYPRQRWEREGRLPFAQWGQVTDGPGTPWAEWYDVEKLIDVLSPARFEVVLNLDIRHGEFVWFDLVRRG